MTIIFPSPIFGPIHSRRLGVSLGINLLPDDGKVCSFDCIYCECGFNAEHRTKKLLPTREEVRTALEEKLKDMQANGPVKQSRGLLTVIVNRRTMPIRTATGLPPNIVENMKQTRRVKTILPSTSLFSVTLTFC